MATFKVQFRRGTTAEHATFTGAQGEITYDTETNQLVLHDGVTPGGHRIPLITDVPTDLSQLTDDGAVLPVQTSIPVELLEVPAATFTSAGMGSLGTGVHISPDISTMVLAEPNVAYGGDNYAGKIHIFSSLSGNWEFVQTMGAPSDSPNSAALTRHTAFGDPVAFNSDGSKMAVMGSGHGGNGTSKNYNGAVWILERQGDGTYTEFDRIDRPRSNSSLPAKDIHMTPDGNYITVVGQNEVDYQNIWMTCDVYKLNSSTGSYEKMSPVTIDGDQVSWYSQSRTQGGVGDAVSRISDDGKVAVIGTPGNWAFVSSGGSAWVSIYDETTQTWGTGQPLNPGMTSNRNPYNVNTYGSSVDIDGDGDVVVIGNKTGGYWTLNPATYYNTGKIVIWRRTGSTWAKEAEINGPEFDTYGSVGFGNSVRVNSAGDTIYVLAPGNSNINTKIYIYRYDNGNWTTDVNEAVTLELQVSNNPDHWTMEINADENLITVFDNATDDVIFAAIP